MFIFFYGIAVTGPKMLKVIVIRIIKLTFARIALVIGIHNNCLILSKIFVFYIVYDTFEAVTKA